MIDRPDVAELLPGEGEHPVRCETTAVVAARVRLARALAGARGVASNADLPANRFDEMAPLSAPARTLLEDRLRRQRLSARGLHRIRRVALTLADLAGREGPIQEEDVCSALVLRGDPFAADEAGA
jgi:magnesium chelatase family protein